MTASYRLSSGRCGTRPRGDRKMRAFLALAGTTTMRKGEVLSLRWDRVHLENAPYATLVRTKTGHQRHVPIPQSIVRTLKALPSHARHEYLFPSRPTARCPEPQRPYHWDFGKQFRALAKRPASRTSAFTTCGTQERRSW